MMDPYGLEYDPFPFLLRCKLTPRTLDALTGDCASVRNRVPPFSARALQEYAKGNHNEEQENTETPLDKSPALEKEIFEPTQAHPLQ